MIGWKQEIVSNRATDILACKDNNGLNITEKENICKEKCKEVCVSSTNKIMMFSLFSLQLQDLKSNLQDLQTEFHQHIKALRKELEEEREARIKLELEVDQLLKIKSF